MLKTLFIIALVCGAAVAGTFYGPGLYQRYIVKSDAKSPDSKEELEKAQWATAKVKRGTIVLSVPATGRVVAKQDIDIKCKSSGQVIYFPKDISDPVVKDELLLELDPIDEQRNVKQAKVNSDSAEAKHASAQENLKLAELALVTDRKRAQASIQSMEAMSEYATQKAARLKAVFDSGSGSREDADAAKTTATQMELELVTAKVKLDELKTQEQALAIKREDVKLAFLNVESARNALEIANQRLKETKIFAPIDGVVSARNVQIGQIISSGISNVGGGTTMLSISDLSSVFVYASVDESEIGKVAVGQDVNITADGLPGMKFPGKVVRIATRGVNVSNVITFETRIEVTGKNKTKLKPEMTANVEIIAAKREDVLLVPSEALSRKAGKRFVLIPMPGAANEDRPVEAGINDGNNIEITAGLSEDETVTYKKGETESRWKADANKGPRMPGMFGGRR